MKFYRLIIIVAAVSMIFCSGCSSSPKPDGLLLPAGGKSLFANQTGTPVSKQDKGQYVDVCQNGRYCLQYRPDIGAVRVWDTASNSISWDSVVTEELYPELASSTQIWKNYMQSILVLNYISVNDTKGNFVLDYSADPNNTIEATAFNNGLSLKINFKKSEISLILEIRLDDGGITFRIPADSIKEGSKYYLYSVELLPFFGAAGKDEDGYVFYPDGSGALSYFKKTDDKHLYTSNLIMDVYSALTHSDLMAESNTNPVARLPVYGIKKGDKAFLAAIAQGDSYSQIYVNTSVNLSTVKLNRASFSMIYRHQYRIYLSNIKKRGKLTAGTLYGTRLDPTLISLDREVKIFFLEGGEANYSGMANAYRNYLLTNNLLKKSSLPSSDSLAVMLFMGIESSNGLANRYIKTTSLNDVPEISRQYREKGVKNLNIILRGWTKDGYASPPEVYKPSPDIGGKKGLEALDDYLAANRELAVFLEMDMVNAIDGKEYFSKGRDVIIQGNRSPVTDTTKTFFNITPYKTFGYFQKAMKKLSYIHNLGFAFTGIGEKIFHDANPAALATRYEAEATYKKILSFRTPDAVSAGNLYALDSVDYLYGIPESSSMNQITDESVPFYQMVVYQTIPYSSIEAGNLTYDLDYQVLKWIEYGCIPYFELTKEDPVLLQDTDYGILFSSQNDRWFDRVVEIYGIFAEKVWPAVGDSYMCAHEWIEDEVVRITYTNGVMIIINYSSTAWSDDTVSVPPKDFAVIGGETK